ncbi:MAG TPA: elongation factor G [Planctomycetota bacterium]|nr:elongation factor G [Planctomycetota bacterium]
MAKIATENIRNIALVGHNGTGKTTLVEGLLYDGGAIKKKGSVAEKNTVSDFDPDEKERGHSIETGVCYFDFQGKHINLLDCPGLPDFAAGAEEGMAACETVMIAVSAVAGVEVMTRKLWSMATALEKPKVFVITKMDHDRAKFDEVIEQLREVFGKPVAPLFLPIGLGKEFKGVINLLDDIHDCPPDLEARAKDLHASLVETAVSADDKVMERYLSDEKISHEEIAHCFTKGILSGMVVPVMCVSAEKDIGLKEMMQVIVEEAPSPLDEPLHLHRKAPEKPGGIENKTITPSVDGPLYAQVFKSKRDPFIGKLSYVRVYSGSLPAGGVAKSSSAAKPDKFAHFLRVQGKELKEQDGVVCGDIVAVAKNENLNFGDTLTTDESGWYIPRIPLPMPMQALAIQAKNRNDEAKVAQRLKQLAEGDPTFLVEVDPQTHELVIRGMGNTHLELMLHRLKAQHIEVTTHPPKIPYRSTIGGTAEVSYTHKKQSGGAGQYGKVQIKIEPNLGNGFEFVDEIVGGVIPRQFIPSCEKGVANKMAEGVWPGIPVVDVRVRLNDGKSHDVDSKDIAFQIAAREAFKEAFEKARPQLIEPVVNLEVVVPAKFMGDITGHLSSHRGRIQGMDQLGDMQVVKAQVPASEVQNYSAELKAITGGEGFYTVEFSHYDIVPNNIAAPVIAAAKSRQVKEVEA